MINLKPQILKKLKEISDVEVSFFYPQSWSKGKKLISYYELDNSEASEKISAQDQGMFLTNTGVLFKAYFLDETQLQELK